MGVASSKTADGSPAREVLWVILAASTLTVMAGSILSPVIPQIRDAVDVSGSLAGLVVTTHAVFIVVVSPVAGALVDRFGPRRPFIWGLLLYAAGGSAGLFVSSFVPLLASRAVLGVGVAFVYTGVTVLLYDLYQGRRMDRALGLRGSATTFGAAVWPLVGGALGTLTWHAPFGVYLVAFPIGLLAVVTVPETGQRATEGGADADNGLADVAGVLRRRPTLLMVYLLYLVANVLLYGLVVFYPQALAGIGVTSPLVISLYMAANGTAGGVSGIFYDRLKRRAGRHAVVLGIFAAWTAALTLAVFTHTPATSVVPPVLFGLGMGLITPSVIGWVEALAPPAHQGSLSSYLASAGYLGQFVSPVFFGLVAATGDPRNVFATGAGVAALALLAVGVALFRRD